MITWMRPFTEAPSLQECCCSADRKHKRYPCSVALHMSTAELQGHRGVMDQRTLRTAWFLQTDGICTMLESEVCSSASYVMCSVSQHFLENIFLIVLILFFYSHIIVK